MPRKRKLPEGIRERCGVYYADFYASGRRVRKRLSTQLDVATELLHELQARADRAEFGLLDNDYALGELKVQYLRHFRQALKASTVDRYEVNLAQVLPAMAATRVQQLTTNAVLLYRQERLTAGISPRTINADVGALATMLRWGVQHALIGTNPLNGLKPLPHDNPKQGRPLTPGEVQKLLDTSPQPWRDIWYAFLVTGVRKDELATLTFLDIDWEVPEIVVGRDVAKNHRERRLPIDTGLWNILKKQEAGRAGRLPGKGRGVKLTAQTKAKFSTENVFVTTQNTPLTHRSGLYKAFMRCCRLAGIETKTLDGNGALVEHVDLHSLRRTFATSLIAGGADPKTVQELLGHSTLDMTMRIYTKINGQTKRQALGKLPYGQGAVVPEGVLEYAKHGQGKAVQNGRRMVTSHPTGTEG